MPGVGEDGDELPIRRRRRWPRVLVGLAGLLLLALLALWLARKPLATHYADRFLAEKGVPARYGIADLGLGRQRLVNVVLGDPADPDLVADWIEARTAIGLSGPYLTGVRGGHVRVRARWVDGKLSLGSLDRLLLAGEGGKPFSLPALALDTDDLRARVETPWGVLGAKLTGSGRLDGGFAGKLAVTGARLGARVGGACAATEPHMAVEVRTFAASLGRRAPSVRLEGSAETAGLACAGARTGYANASGRGQIVLGDAISWTLDTDVSGVQVRHAAAAAQGVTGRVRFAGQSGRIAGDVALAGTQVAATGVSAAAVRLTGQVLRDPARRTPFAYTGQAAWTGARWRGVDLRRAGAAGAGTPLAPLLRRATSSTAAALRRFEGAAAIYLASMPAGLTVQVSRLAARSASGARLSFGGGIATWFSGGATVDGTAQLTGGGLPTATVRVLPAGPGAFRGTADVAPYAVGGARLALTPVRFAVGPGGGTAATSATLSGPLADGRVDGLVVPVDARWSTAGMSLGPACTAVGWQRVAVAGLTLDPGGVRLCPTGRALIDLRDGRIAGGATLGATRLTGRLGTTPLTLAAAGARLSVGERGFTLTDVAARLGRPDRLTRLDLAALDGRVTPTGLTGRFAGAGGQIGAVPLLLSDAAGDWRLARGALTLGGGMTVSDAQTVRPRFKPLPLREVALTLADGRVDAAGKLRAPTDARPVADLRLTHDLARGVGNARFTVPGLLFDKDLQPEQLTPVTFGVIAEVRGTVTGAGAIDWTPAGVTSTGAFATTGTDLAAAFGPVQGIAGTIRFTDLLALESAAGQQLAVRSVNPGIAVTDGVVRFQTLADARVQVEGARWPFAGGTLTLDPSLLDFGQTAQRRLVFRIAGMAADQFLQQFDFKNLDATGIFDGVLPMMFDQGGGRIEDGRLQVRQGPDGGGGTIAYVGPITQEDVGFWPNLAFQALKSLRYRSLAIVMNGPLAGEMVTEVRFAGVSQGEGAHRGGIAGLLVGRLQRLPFLFNIRIQAPFRGLLDATASFYDPRRLIQRNLPQLLDEQNKRAAPPAPPAPIQPPASEIVP